MHHTRCHCLTYISVHNHLSSSSTQWIREARTNQFPVCHLAAEGPAWGNTADGSNTDGRGHLLCSASFYRGLFRCRELIAALLTPRSLRTSENRKLADLSALNVGVLLPWANRVTFSWIHTETRRHTLYCFSFYINSSQRVKQSHVTTETPPCDVVIVPVVTVLAADVGVTSLRSLWGSSSSLVREWHHYFKSSGKYVGSISYGSPKTEKPDNLIICKEPTTLPVFLCGKTGSRCEHLSTRGHWLSVQVPLFQSGAESQSGDLFLERRGGTSERSLWWTPPNERRPCVGKYKWLKRTRKHKSLLGNILTLR